MGQGTAGMWFEDEYDERDFNGNSELEFGRYWIGKSHQRYEVSKMSDRHIKNTIRMCHDLADCANFEDERDKWLGWVDVFESELYGRREPVLSSPYDRQVKQNKNRGKNSNGKPVTKSIKQALKEGDITSGSVQMKCHCGAEYKAKVGDLRRGWALSCSKRCAAIRRDFGRSEATLLLQKP